MKEWLILELEFHEMIRVAHIVAWPMDLNLLCDRSQQLGALNVAFLGFYSIVDLFSNI